jgi:hypothetical protein
MKLQPRSDRHNDKHGGVDTSEIGVAKSVLKGWWSCA